MGNIKDFQARYDRWKNGERYWDIRGIDLPQYDSANKNTITTDDGSVFNVDPSAIGARNLEVTTPEVEIIAQKPLYLKKRDQLLGDIIYNPGEIRQGEEPSTLDKVRMFLGNHRDNPIARNVEQSIEDWQHHKTPMQAAFDNFAYMNPYTAAIAAGSNLFSDHGVSKTINLAKNGQYGRAALSGLGDLFDASMLSYGGRYIKNNGMFDAAKFFENTRFGDYLRSKIISNNLNRSITELPNGRFRYQDKVLPYKRIDLTPKTSISKEEVNVPFKGKLQNYLTESGESMIYDDGQYVLKEKSLYDVNSSIDKLHQNVSRDLAMNQIPGIQPIEYLGYKINTNPQKIINGLTGKVETRLNKTYDPIYRQRKLVPLDDSKTKFMYQPNPYRLLDQYGIKHDKDFGYVKDITFSDFGLNNWGINNYGQYRMFDPMIHDF